MATKIKNLSSSKILALHSKSFSQKVIYVDVGGENYAVTIDQKFQPTKLQAMILELVEKATQITQLSNVFDISNYANFLIIKYFTDIDMTKTDDFETQIRVFKALVDLEIFDAIIDKFDESEIEKISVYINKMSEKLKELEKNPKAFDDINEVMTEISQLENPDEESPTE